jgi:hypothetical protein
MVDRVKAKKFAHRLCQDSRFEEAFFHFMRLRKRRDRNINHNPYFYEDTASHSQELQDLLNSHNAARNREFHGIEELVSGVKNFAVIQYDLFSAEHTLSKSRLPERLVGPILDDIQRYKDSFFHEMQNMSQALLERFRPLGLRPSRYLLSKAGRGLRDLLARDMNGDESVLETDIIPADEIGDDNGNGMRRQRERMQAGIFCLHFKRIAREYLDAQDDSELKAPEVKATVGEGISEGGLRYHKNRVHGLLSDYDTRVRPAQKIDQDLSCLSTIVQASRDILEATMYMTHFFERHVYSDAVDKDLVDFEKIIRTDEALEFIWNFGTRYVHRLLTYGHDEEIPKIEKKGYIPYHEVVTDPPEAGFHVRPSTYAVKVNSTYGIVSMLLGWTNPEGRTIWNPTEYEVESVLQMMGRPNEELERLKREHPDSEIKVKFRGPKSAVDDLKTLAEEYTWGENVVYEDRPPGEPRKISYIEDVPLPSERFAYLAETQKSVLKQRGKK